LKIKALHSWPSAVRPAINLQDELCGRLVFGPLPAEPRFLAGCDCGLNLKANIICAGVIVYRFPELAEIERSCAFMPIPFPYVPGLLSFREVPVLLKAFGGLKTTPDLVLCDGQGYAHPRRMGEASHLGLWLDIPVVGCAKSRLIGEYKEPGPRRGDSASVMDKGEEVARALTSRDGCRPLFISAGYKITLDESVRITLACADGHRIPKPTREADRWVKGLAKNHKAD